MDVRTNHDRNKPAALQIGLTTPKETEDCIIPRRTYVDTVGATQTISDLRDLGCDLLSHMTYLQDVLIYGGFEFDNRRTDNLSDKANKMLSCPGTPMSLTTTMTSPHSDPVVLNLVSDHSRKSSSGISVCTTQSEPSTSTAATENVVENDAQPKGQAETFVKVDIKQNDHLGVSVDVEVSEGQPSTESPSPTATNCAINNDASTEVLKEATLPDQDDEPSASAANDTLENPEAVSPKSNLSEQLHELEGTELACFPFLDDLSSSPILASRLPDVEVHASSLSEFNESSGSSEPIHDTQTSTEGKLTRASSYDSLFDDSGEVELSKLDTEGVELRERSNTTVQATPFDYSETSLVENKGEPSSTSAVDHVHLDEIQDYRMLSNDAHEDVVSKIDTNDVESCEMSNTTIQTIPVDSSEISLVGDDGASISTNADDHMSMDGYRDDQKMNEIPPVEIIAAESTDSIRGDTSSTPSETILTEPESLISDSDSETAVLCDELLAHDNPIVEDSTNDGVENKPEELSEADVSNTMTNKDDVCTTLASQQCFIPEEDGNGLSHVFPANSNDMNPGSKWPSANQLLFLDGTLTNIGYMKGDSDSEVETGLATDSKKAKETAIVNFPEQCANDESYFIPQEKGKELSRIFPTSIHGGIPGQVGLTIPAMPAPTFTSFTSMVDALINNSRQSKNKKDLNTKCKADTNSSNLQLIGPINTSSTVTETVVHDEERLQKPSMVQYHRPLLLEFQSIQHQAATKKLLVFGGTAIMFEEVLTTTITQGDCLVEKSDDSDFSSPHASEQIEEREVETPSNFARPHAKNPSEKLPSTDIESDSKPATESAEPDSSAKVGTSSGSFEARPAVVATGNPKGSYDKLPSDDIKSVSELVTDFPQPVSPGKDDQNPPNLEAQQTDVTLDTPEDNTIETEVSNLLMSDPTPAKTASQKRNAKRRRAKTRKQEAAKTKYTSRRCCACK